MMNKHILLYSDDPGLGGVAQYNHTLLCGLSGLGYRLTFVQSKIPNPLVETQEELGIKHIWLEFDTTKEQERTVHDGSHAQNIFENAKPDLIIFSDTWPLANSGVKQIAIALGIPYIVVVGFVAPYPGGLPSIFLNMMLQLYEQAKAVIAVSHENLDLLHQLFGLSQDKGQVIYYGRPAKYFSYPNKLVRNHLRQELNIPLDAVVCFTSARLDYMKGYNYQLAAIESLKNTDIWDSLYFVWAGDGKQKHEIEAAIVQLEIADKIKILGQRWDIPDLLDVADIFILPSLLEGMPLAIMEAMAKGLPVIASAVSGIPEELGDTGYLLPDPKIDPDGTVNGLVTTIVAWCPDIELRKSIGKSCKNRALKLFTEERMIAETDKIIQNIFFTSWDYISPEFELICPDSCFPNMIVGNTNNCCWSYLRRGINHNWYVDTRHPSVGFLSRDEVHILYNTALKFEGKKALEIGCWLGWSACHLALAGVELDVVDPLLGKQEFHKSVTSSLEAAEVLSSVNLFSGYSPEKVEELGGQLQRKWSLIFIDGNHDAPAPLYDAISCEKYAEENALILFHDLVSPDVAQGLEYLRQRGWNVMIYQTMQIMGVAWRGNIKPVNHEPDPQIDWHLPKHLQNYLVSGTSKRSDIAPFRYGKLCIDIVLQATGKHGWSVSQGWINTLQQKGLLNRVFRPIAAWGAEEPTDDDGLFEYLRNPQADTILMLGFDWHSQPLHKTIKWQERWQKAQITKIAILQECYSAEVVQNTPAWQYQMHQAITSTLSCVDALICNHEPDVDFFKNQLGISLPIIFLPFYIDSEHFRNQNTFINRLNRVLFRGNAPRYFTENTYKERQTLIEALSQYQNVDLFSSNLYGAKYPFDIMQEYVHELNSYRILLNLPSLAPTFTVRPFEIMACGGLLLQNRIIGEQSQTLFKNWQHLVYYDADKPEDLLGKIEYLIANPDLAAKIAAQGQSICHKLHTTECRINTILKWINDDFKTTSFFNDIEYINQQNNLEIINFTIPTYTELSNLSKVIIQRNCKIIVDGVFFQLYQTGIARVWKSLLEEWARNGFAKYIIVIDRDGTTPKIPGIKYRNVERYDYKNTVADREMLQQVCDEEGANIFISSYYTTPNTTPSVFIAYDMNPEVMGWNMNNPMWQEKHHGIRYASAYIAISKHTARDLVKYFSHITIESITVAHCGVSNNFSPDNLEKVNAFKAKYGIAKPYFLLVGVVGGYKNSILFFQAFSQLDTSNGFDIVLTGSGGILASEFRPYTSGSIVHTLQLNDEELATAYSGAVALVYPSKYEGFGMPIVEAMACGCPVITCPNASIPEAAGEAAIYVSDDDVDGLANALCEVQKPGIRKSLITAGLAQSEQFSWSKMADTVSSALIDATLIYLNLKDINLIIFPDWSQSEEAISLELQKLIKALATHPDREKTTLLIDTNNISIEDAELLLSGVTMNLLMQEDLDVTEGLEISLVGNLADIQWEALLPRIHARIVLEYENKQTLAQVSAEKLLSYRINSLYQATANC